MVLTEINKNILSKDKQIIEHIEVKDEDLKTFMELITISNTAKTYFNTTDDANTFYSLFPYIKDIIGKVNCVEIFYACKLGYYVKGVPSKLIWIINKMSKLYEGPCVNAMIKSASQFIKSYCNNSYKVDGDIMTIKDIIESNLKYRINLITEEVPMVNYDTFSEIYVENVDRVLLVPKNIASLISLQDCKDISYIKDKGVCIKDIPIRTLGNRLGITKNDFDLRDAI